MTHRSHNVKKPKVNDEKPTVIDFGKRTISNQNFSKMVALPKQALANCGGEAAKHVDVSLVQDRNERYLKLRPICKPVEDDDTK